MWTPALGCLEEKLKKIKVLILSLFFVLLPTFLSGQTENKNEVDIHIQHGIEINDTIPGYRIIVTNWGCREVLSLYLVDSEGNEINFISDKQNVKSDENGIISIDIPYTYKEIKPGICMLLVAGKPGVHMIKIEYPKLEPPTEEKPYWDIWFSNTSNEE